MATQRPDIQVGMGRGNPGGGETYYLGNPEKTVNYTTFQEGRGDARNAQPIIDINTNGPIPKGVTRDMIKFNIQVIDPAEPNNAELLVFRAYLDDVSDDYTANYSDYKYNGRAEKFYIYNSFDRKISFSFRIQAQSRQEMKPLYQKLNYLVAQTAPQYSNGRMRSKFNRLTIGDWCNEVPGFFTNIGLSWKGAYSWEIDSEETTGADGERMNQLPHQLDVKCSYIPIHDFAPENSQSSPFILPHRRVDDDQKWTR